MVAIAYLILLTDLSIGGFLTDNQRSRWTVLEGFYLRNILEQDLIPPEKPTRLPSTATALKEDDLVATEWIRMLGTLVQLPAPYTNDERPVLLYCAPTLHAWEASGRYQYMDADFWFFLKLHSICMRL